MTIWWCRGCGMEDTLARDSCPTCGLALEPGQVQWLEGSGADSQDNETIFEIEPEPVERAAIVDGLIARGIDHRWDSPTELVVHDDTANEVDVILDEVLGEDTRDYNEGEYADMDYDEVEEFDSDVYEDEDDSTDDSGLSEDSDNDVDDELEEEDESGGYELMSDLFEAADSLTRGSMSEAEGQQFFQLVNEVVESAPPYGVDDELWADIQASARNIAAVLHADSSADVEQDARGLRALLHPLV